MGVPEWEDLIESHGWYQGCDGSNDKQRAGQSFVDRLADK